MPTIIRQGGFDVTIFTNDHSPAHVHVFKASAELILNLAPVSIRDNYRMSKADVRKAIDIVSDYQQVLLQAWSEIHGDE
jgi:hypothetical protein